MATKNTAKKLAKVEHLQPEQLPSLPTPKKRAPRKTGKQKAVKTKPAEQLMDVVFDEHTLPSTPNPTLPVQTKKRTVRKIGKKMGVQAEPQGFIDEVVIACRGQNRLSTYFGSVFGGIVPFLVFIEAHYDGIHMGDALNALLKFEYYEIRGALLIVLGGLIVSSIKVYNAMVEAYDSKFQAGATVILLEGTLSFSHVEFHGVYWLSLIALALLMGVNALVSSTKLALKRTLKE